MHVVVLKTVYKTLEYFKETSELEQNVEKFGKSVPTPVFSTFDADKYEIKETGYDLHVNPIMNVMRSWVPGFLVITFTNETEAIVFEPFDKILTIMNSQKVMPNLVGFN